MVQGRGASWVIQVSIHASPQRQGELAVRRCRIVHGDVSIHASPQRQGEQLACTHSSAVQSVSIHASPQRQGERARVRATKVVIGFNPRLASEARRTRIYPEGMRALYVSIHASPQRQGERWSRIVRVSASKFQSTPRLRGKANPALRMLRQPTACFNPRLASEARRTCRWFDCNTSWAVSIHASPQRQGERQATNSDATSYQFQSTPRLRGKANPVPFAHFVSSLVSIHASPQRQGEQLLW